MIKGRESYEKGIKIFLMGTAAFVSIGFFGWYVNKYLLRSKASTEIVNVTMTSTNFATLKQGGTGSVTMTLTTANSSRKISGVDLVLTSTDAIAFTSAASSNSYFDEQLISTKTVSGTTQTVHVALVAKKADTALSNTAVITLNFNAAKVGTGKLTLDKTKSQVVGITGSTDINDTWFSFPSQEISVNYAVIASGCTSPSDCGTNATCTSSQCGCVTGYNNCDGSWTNGCEKQGACTNPTAQPTSVQPTSTQPTTTIQPTQADEGSLKLNISFKFQGIGSVPDAQKTQPVKVTLKKGTAEVGTKTVNFTINDDGVWKGTAGFDSQPGSNYTVLLKGPKHIKKKICVNEPTESAAGVYRCGTEEITLAEGDNTLNFTGVLLLTGDLPIGGQQDGVADAVDIAYIINNLGKSDADVLAAGDVNMNGGIDVADFSLIRYALSIHPDEE